MNKSCISKKFLAESFKSIDIYLNSKVDLYQEEMVDFSDKRGSKITFINCTSNLAGISDNQHINCFWNWITSASCNMD